MPRARETVRKQDGLVRILPDGVVDAVIETSSGPLSPGRCLAIRLLLEPAHHSGNTRNSWHFTNYMITDV